MLGLPLRPGGRCILAVGTLEIVGVLPDLCRTFGILVLAPIHPH